MLLMHFVMEHQPRQLAFPEVVVYLGDVLGYLKAWCTSVMYHMLYPWLYLQEVPAGGRGDVSVTVSEQRFAFLHDRQAAPPLMLYSLLSDMQWWLLQTGW